MEEETIMNELNAPHQMALPMKKIRISEVKSVIKRKIHPKKPPGYDLITGKVFQELSHKALRAITQIQRHTTNRILSLSVESRTNHYDRKTGKQTQTT